MEPTLLRKGFIVPSKNETPTQKSIIENTVSINYIIQCLEKIDKRHDSYGNRVVVIKSDTGSGKSTILPPAIYNAFQCNVIVTQPRILTTIDIPNIIAEYNKNLKLDMNIGYMTKNFKRIPSQTGILFATIGVLVQQLILMPDEQFMKKYRFIVLDEIHERDVETDLCLFFLKKFLKKNYQNPHCPIVITMSATMDEKIFMNYFETANFIQVKGSTFPIEENFPEYSISNYAEYAVLKAQQIHLQNPGEENGDIIIFVQDASIAKKIYGKLHEFNTVLYNQTGEDQLSEITLKLQSLLKKGGGTAGFILPIILNKLNFEKGDVDYKNLFSSIQTVHVVIQPTGNYETPTRRVIIATNIAETGITIPTLKYCIDTGLKFSAEYYPEYACAALIAKNIDRSAALQRKGRVGRKAPGIWFPLYTKETYEALDENSLPKIITADFTETFLSILVKQKSANFEACHVIEFHNQQHDEHIKLYSGSHRMFKLVQEPFDIKELDLIEMPSIQGIITAKQKLFLLGFIEENENVTPVGFYANQIRFISMESRRMIFAGYYYETNVSDLITIAAFIHVKKHIVFSSIESSENDDFIHCIVIWKNFMRFLSSDLSSKTYENIIDWTEKNGINFAGFMEVISMRQSIIENMLTIGLNPYYNKDYDSLADKKSIKYCIYQGFKCNVLKREEMGFRCLMNCLPIAVKSANLPSTQKYIIVDSYLLAKKKVNFAFSSESFICTLDEYVNVDENVYRL